MWTYNGRIMALNRAKIAGITDQDYSDPPAEGWVSHTQLRRLLPPRTRNIMQLLREAHVKQGDRTLNRDERGVLDAYYAGDAAERVIQAAA
jgi:hypothetical protein